MFRDNLKTAFITFLVGIFFAISAIAFAATSSWYNYGPVYGYSYRNQAEVILTFEAGSDVVQASTYAECSTGNVPEGYIGARGMLYRSDGALVRDSGWDYTTQTSRGMYQPTRTYSNPGYYYSKGQSKAYNGNGYNTYSTNQTVNIKL